MTRKQNSAKRTDWKALMTEQEDFLRPLIREVIQQVLEAEMDEAVGAAKGERTPEWQGYRAGYYSQTLVTRVGKLELRVPQDRRDASARRSSSAISGARKRWYRH